MNKVIFNLTKILNNNKVISNLNRIKHNTMNAKTKLEQCKIFIAKRNQCNHHNPFHMNKRHFSNFSNFSNFPIPPNPGDPDLLFMILLATMGYIIIKKI
jgi:hypothetical protein